MPTIGDVLYQSSRRLLDAGIDTGALEASLLLGRATGLDRLRLITRTAEDLGEGDVRNFELLLERRLKREPLQYILGETEFMGMNFEVGPAVLIPRADTEILVEAVLDLEEELGNSDPIVAADIGTGSGAIAVVLAKSLPYMRVIASDLSTEALAIARTNAKRHGVDKQIEFRHGDGLEVLDQPVRYLVSNPPYIASEDLAGLEPEVRDFEPPIALSPGEDSLRWYRTFATDGAKLVEPGGYLAVEVGMGQASAVIELLEGLPYWETPVVKKDLAGIERVVLAKRKA